MGQLIFATEHKKAVRTHMFLIHLLVSTITILFSAKITGCETITAIFEVGLIILVAASRTDLSIALLGSILVLLPQDVRLHTEHPRNTY